MLTLIERSGSLPLEKIRFYLKTLNEPTRVKIAVLFAIKEALGKDYLEKIEIKRVNHLEESFFEVEIHTFDQETAEFFVSLKNSVERIARYFSDCNISVKLER